LTQIRNIWISFNVVSSKWFYDIIGWVTERPSSLYNLAPAIPKGYCLKDQSGTQLKLE